MTPKFKPGGGPLHAYQITCKHPDHGICNKTFALSKCASEEELLRMLKTWAVMGCDVPDKEIHKILWDDVENSRIAGALPETEDLDAQMIRRRDDYV